MNFFWQISYPTLPLVPADALNRITPGFVHFFVHPPLVPLVPSRLVCVAWPWFEEPSRVLEPLLMYLPSQLHFLPGFLQSCPLKTCQLLEGVCRQLLCSFWVVPSCLICPSRSSHSCDCISVFVTWVTVLASLGLCFPGETDRCEGRVIFCSSLEDAGLWVPLCMSCVCAHLPVTLKNSSFL